MNLSELKDFLAAAGWTFIPKDHLHESGVDWRACRRSAGLPNCLCNNRSPEIILTPWCIPEAPVESVAVTIWGETPAGWVSLEAYNLSLDPKAIENACRSMEAAWTAAAGTPCVEP